MTSLLPIRRLGSAIFSRASVPTSLPILVLLVASTTYGAVVLPSGLIPGDNYHLVFTSSSLHGLDTFTFVPPFNFPDFGGVDAADWVVTNAASAAGLAPGWNGVSPVYKAVISNDTENAKDRVNIMAPVYNAAGQRVATGEADFFDGQLENLMNLDENRVARTGEVWTGTLGNGTATADTCGDNWNNNSSGINGTVGDSNSTSSPFSGAGTRACNTDARLYGVSPLLQVEAFSQAGDFDGDDDVGGLDFLAWQLSQQSPANLVLWEANYGAGALAASAAVPEPSYILLAGLASLLFCSRRR